MAIEDDMGDEQEDELEAEAPQENLEQPKDDLQMRNIDLVEATKLEDLASSHFVLTSSELNCLQTLAIYDHKTPTEVLRKLLEIEREMSHRQVDINYLYRAALFLRFLHNKVFDLSAFTAILNSFQEYGELLLDLQAKQQQMNENIRIIDAQTKEIQTNDAKLKQWYEIAIETKILPLRNTELALEKKIKLLKYEATKLEEYKEQTTKK